jgi:hypothetical protein
MDVEKVGVQQSSMSVILYIPGFSGLASSVALISTVG